MNQTPTLIDEATTTTKIIKTQSVEGIGRPVIIKRSQQQVR